MYVQEILDQEFPGFTIRIFAEDFQNEGGNPAKFTIKLTNPAGTPKKGGKGGKSKGKRGGKGGGKGKSPSAPTVADFIPPHQNK